MMNLIMYLFILPPPLTEAAQPPSTFLSNHSKKGRAKELETEELSFRFRMRSRPTGISPGKAYYPPILLLCQYRSFSLQTVAFLNKCRRKWKLTAKISKKGIDFSENKHII